MLLVLFCLTVLPLLAHAAVYSVNNSWAIGWREADWSSAGVLPLAGERPDAFVGIYAARAGEWRGIFAVHSWLVYKPAGADRYTRYDVVGWGRPMRRDAYPPDGRWFGNAPELVGSLTGRAAEAAIERIEAAIASYPYAERASYRLWPGPNSNSFIAHMVAQLPESGIVMPPEALGRDFPVDGRWLGLTPSRMGVFATLGGYVGLTLGWYEGLEVNVFGTVAGLDIRRPALKLPGFGRIGMAR